ncbi:MAG TPA: ABC transporter substrate-binding protein [Stellaceae bacterium]|jgi:NitT/TauT family transport system substrate-binding protein|nr:ABC transporter substrate-binding protein [Stellaceae bacterium]
MIALHRSLLAALMLALAGAPAAADPLKIRMDWAQTPGQFAPLIPTTPQYGPDVYRHYGKSYVVEPLKLAGGGATLTALATGDTDVSTLSPQTLVLGVTNAKIDMRVIGQQLTTELPGYLQTYFWVHANEIKTIDDLKGKVIGVSAIGSNVDSAARMVMAKHALIPPRDFSVLEISFPTQLPALLDHRLDAAVLVPPFHLKAKADPTLKPIFSVGDAFGPVETLIWIARADFVAKNRAALVDMLEDNIRMRRWIFDPKTRADAVRQVADYTKIPAAALDQWVYTQGDYYFEPNAKVDVARLQNNVALMKDAGIVPQAIDVRPYVDMSLAEEAAARIKD